MKKRFSILGQEQLEFFQSEGKIPVDRQGLKIRERESEIVGAVL